MAVSTHTVKASDGSSTKPADNPNSGTVANGGNIAGSLLTAQSPMALVKGADRYGSYITTRTGTASIPGINKANTSGRVAFNPNAETRTLANTGFVIRGGVGNNVAGVSGLNPIAVNGYKGAKRSNGVHKKINTMATVSGLILYLICSLVLEKLLMVQLRLIFRITELLRLTLTQFMLAILLLILLHLQVEQLRVNSSS